MWVGWLGCGQGAGASATKGRVHCFIRILNCFNNCIQFQFSATLSAEYFVTLLLPHKTYTRMQRRSRKLPSLTDSINMLKI